MPTGRASIFTARHVLVVDTKCVALPTDPHVISHYEIHTAPDASWPYPTVFVTPDVDLYDAALAAEGEHERFDLSWTHGYCPNGKRGQLIVDLQRVPLAELETI